MISQNRADAKRQVIADQQWQNVKEEDKQNEELLDLSNQILARRRRSTPTRVPARKARRQRAHEPRWRASQSGTRSARRHHRTPAERTTTYMNSR
jgi:hypothetical protein